MMRSGYTWFLKAVQRRGFDIARIEMELNAAYTLFRSILVGFQSIRNERITYFTPYTWKEHVFHRGLSWNYQSILGKGFIPGGKEKDKARQAVFLTHVLKENTSTRPISSDWKLTAQKNWAWQESWDRSVSKTGKIHENLYHWREEWKELKNYELVKSQCKNLEKIMSQYKSSLLSCKKCKNRWILWVTQEIFQITVRDCLTFPVSLQWFQVLVPCWAATNACLLTHGIHRDYRETFVVINFPRLIHSEIILKEFNLAHHRESENQFHRPQGWRLFSQDDKQRRDTIPMPTFARRPSTVSSVIHVEFQHNCMAGQQRANFGIAIRQIP